MLNSRDKSPMSVVWRCGSAKQSMTSLSPCRGRSGKQQYIRISETRPQKNTQVTSIKRLVTCVFYIIVISLMILQLRIRMLLIPLQKLQRQLLN